MTAALYSPLVERALRVAAAAHRDQTRKASTLPYLTHPASVALLLARAGIDDDCVLAAALLHDVVEDTAYDLAQLRAEFPASVIEYVAAASERKLDDAGRKRSWRERKTEHLATIVTACWQARAIILADKLHNLGSMLYDLDEGAELWTRFNAGPEEIIWYHRAIIAAASQEDPRLEPLAHACRELLARLEATLCSGG
jgi:(p)ppGpp synthase/HD superfamily hydrolase